MATATEAPAPVQETRSDRIVLICNYTALGLFTLAVLYPLVYVVSASLSENRVKALLEKASFISVRQRMPRGGRCHAGRHHGAARPDRVTLQDMSSRGSLGDRGISARRGVARETRGPSLQRRPPRGDPSGVPFGMKCPQRS